MRLILGLDDFVVLIFFFCLVTEKMREGEGKYFIIIEFDTALFVASTGLLSKLFVTRY